LFFHLFLIDFYNLIGIAPNGAITFVSKCHGGRASDTMITNTSGFLSKLASGDMVMADKGFPVIKSVKGVITVIPPKASSAKKQFSAEEMESTQKIASVRIHVERVIQRLKIFQILTNRFDHSLLPHVDKIVHCCAVLVNLQAPIIKWTAAGPNTEEQQQQPEQDDEEDNEEDEGEEEERGDDDNDRCSSSDSDDSSDIADYL
jgi:hypothetical protein